jgi:phosphoribosyl-ATP pyrophosphohydrolase
VCRCGGLAERGETGMSTHILDQLWQIIEARKNADPQESYSAALLAAAPEKPARKLAEETTETIIEALKGDKAGISRESADLLYHLLILWAAAGVTPQQVWAELAKRMGQSGHAEKAARKPR